MIPRRLPVSYASVARSDRALARSSRGLAALGIVGALMISGQTAASAQSAGAACSKPGASSPNGSLVCRKVSSKGKTVLRWSARTTSSAPQPPKGPSNKDCLIGAWAETPNSVQTFLAQYAPGVPMQVSGQLRYAFDGANLTASGEMAVSAGDPGANVAGTLRAVGKPFPATYDGIALSMKLAPDSDYPRFFDVTLTVNGAAVAVPTGSPGGPAFFPVACSGAHAWVTVQTPRGVIVRVLDRVTP